MVAAKVQNEIGSFLLLLFASLVIVAAVAGTFLLIGFLYWLKNHLIIERLVFSVWWGFWGWVLVTGRYDKIIARMNEKY